MSVVLQIYAIIVTFILELWREMIRHLEMLSGNLVHGLEKAEILWYMEVQSPVYGTDSRKCAECRGKSNRRGTTVFYRF